MLEHLGATIVASALQHAPGERKSVWLQMRSTTAEVTFVPNDIGPPMLEQAPTGLARVRNSIERKIDTLAHLIETVAQILPIDREADAILGRHLVQLQAGETFEPLVTTYDED